MREYCPSRRYYISEILNRETLYEQGVFRRVREWKRGWNKEDGLFCIGWSGKETLIERDIIRPLNIFEVSDK